MKLLSSFLIGAMFALGLVFAGMTAPDTVIAFLDVTGLWNPNLGLVMGAALLTAGALGAIFSRRERPIFESMFHLPTRRDITPSLLFGSAVFGVGWGLSGMCPGPGLVSAFALVPEGAVFLVALVAGMSLFRVIEVARGHS